MKKCRFTGVSLWTKDPDPDIRFFYRILIRLTHYTSLKVTYVVMYVTTPLYPNNVIKTFSNLRK